MMFHFMYIGYLVYPFFPDGHLGYFHILTLVRNAAVNVNEQILVEVRVASLFPKGLCQFILHH